MEPVKSADSTSAIAEGSIGKTNISIEMQSFCARVMNMCDYITGANKLTDIVGLRHIAEQIKQEALGVSKSFYKL